VATRSEYAQQISVRSSDIVDMVAAPSTNVISAHASALWRRRRAVLILIGR